MLNFDQINNKSQHVHSIVMECFEWKRDYCLKCGKCCLNTEMILLDEDIKRIQKLGYKIDFFVRKLHNYNVLKNTRGHCVFFEPKSKKCKIYENRPLGCRLYPIIYDDEKGVSVDPYCPLAHTVTSEELEKASKVISQIIEKLFP